MDTKKREFLSDYALPVAIIVMSFVGSYLAGDIKCKVELVSGCRQTCRQTDM